MYSDVFERESTEPKKTREYYKKVEQTTTKTVIQNGNKPGTSKVVSTTIIKNGDNEPQISKKVYSSNNYGSYEKSRRFEGGAQKFGDFKKNGVSSKFSKKVMTTSSKNYKYSGLVPSSQTVNTSSKYKTKTTNQIISKSGGSYNSSNNTYISDKGKSGFRKNYGVSKDIRSYSTSSQQKDQYSYAGKVKEKSNYMYYVSGIGYVTKEEADEANQAKKENRVYQSKSKSVPKPIIRNERVTITIQSKRAEKKEGKLVENYEYYESKDIKKQDRNTIVIHRRLGEPFYQNITTESKKFSSYTSGPRGYKSNYSLNQKDYSVDGGKTKTIESDYGKNYKYRNKTEDKKGIFDTSKYKSSSTNKYQTYQSQTVSSAKESQSQNTLSNYGNVKNYGGSKYNSSSHQRTLEVGDNRKYGYGAKTKYEQSLTEVNKEGKSQIDYSKNRGTSSSQGRQTQFNYSSTSQEKRKYMPPKYKKYEEKTEESYKRGEKKDYSQDSKKIFDTAKYAKGKDNTSKYSKYQQNSTEEKYKKEEINRKYQKVGYNIPKYQPKTGTSYPKDSSKTGSTYKKDSASSQQNLKDSSNVQQYKSKIETSYQKDSLSGQNYGEDAKKQGDQQQGEFDNQQEGIESQEYQLDENAQNQNQQQTDLDYQQGGYGIDSQQYAISGQKYQQDTYGVESGAEYGISSGVEYGVGSGAEYGVGSRTEYEAGAGAKYEAGDGEYGTGAEVDYDARAREEYGAGAREEYGAGSGEEYRAGAGEEYGVGAEVDYGSGAGAEYAVGVGAEYGTEYGAGYEQNQYQQQSELKYQQEGLEGQNYPIGENGQNLYQQQTEKIYQQEQAQAQLQYSQQGKDAELQDMNIINYCPIHGQRGQEGGISKKVGRTMGNKYEYINEQVNNTYGENEEESDNYRFYESKNFTKKVQNITSVNSVNVQNYENSLNIRNMTGQDNLIRTVNAIGMSQELQGTQGLLGMEGISASQGYDTKLYIATKVTPVYSEIISQNNLISGHVCNVCGNPMRQGQISRAQQIVYSSSNNSCPIHGKEITQQQYSGY